MKNLLFVLFLVSACLLNAQELENIKIGNGDNTTVKFKRINDNYYQVGVFEEEITVGVENNTEVLSEAGNSMLKIYAVKYDLDFNIIWTKIVAHTFNNPKVQFKSFNNYLYILSNESYNGYRVHHMHRINQDDPDDITNNLLRFETSENTNEYDFAVSPSGDIAVAGTYSSRVKFYFSGQSR